MVTENSTSPIDCACVIHGDGYSWDYVDRLYKMLTRHLSRPVRLHVYTEKERTVPEPYIKHTLKNWGISGPKKSWWYKIQIFNTEYHKGPLLYFDLDVVIVKSIDWICQNSPDYFWTVRDFKYLWQSNNYSINSSIMWFDTTQFEYLWTKFISQDLNKILIKHRGDQNYINDTLDYNKVRYLDQQKIKSWKWQCLDGGYMFEKKQHLLPNTGTTLTDLTSVLIFHGKPKPSEVTDSLISCHWQ